MQGALVRSTGIVFWHYAGTTGLTLKAVVLNGSFGAFNFTTGAFITNVATATWSELQRDLTEIVDTSPNPMGIYSSTTSFPAALVPGDYTVVIQDGTTAVDDRLAIQPMHWDGTYWTPADQYNSELLATVASGVALATQGMTPASIHPSQIWRVARIDGAVRSRHTIIKSPGETPLVVIANFSQLLGPNETIESVDSVALIDGDVDSTAFDDVGEAVLTGDNVQFELTGGTQDGDGDPGENVIRVEVTTSLGNNFKPDCLLNVVGAADP